jgi:hypothetical protein
VRTNRSATPFACGARNGVCRRQKEPVGPRHHGTAGSSPEDAEFVPKHDDFQIPRTSVTVTSDPPKLCSITRRPPARGARVTYRARVALDGANARGALFVENTVRGGSLMWVTADNSTDLWG